MALSQAAAFTTKSILEAPDQDLVIADLFAALGRASPCYCTATIIHMGLLSYNLKVRFSIQIGYYPDVSRSFPLLEPSFFTTPSYMTSLPYLPGAFRIFAVRILN